MEGTEYLGKEILIEIYTVNGSLVKTFREENTSGKTIQLDIASINAGVYFISFSSNKSVTKKKLVILK